MMNSSLFSRTFLRRIAIAASVLTFAVTTTFSAQAQSDDSSGAGAAHAAYSSSTDWKAYLDTDGLFNGSPSGTGSGSASPAAGGQYGQAGSRYPGYQNHWDKLAIVAGAGFTAPLGNTTHGGPNYPNSIGETYGYNIKAGAGWNFTKRFGALLEYNFNRDKIPGDTLTPLAIESGLGTPIGGNVNTWSLTIEPIFYLPVTKKMGGYVTGGGGFYRKVTNFTAPQVENDFFFEVVVPTTVAHSSSNQGGLNFGVGAYWKAFGEDSNAKLFTEVRYVWVDSPVASNSSPFASGTSSLLPITFGIRF
jgi:hypothetical protein